MLSEQAAWVGRARAGDRAAFAELYARYERRIYSFVYRTMGNHEDAAELTQETFLKAYHALGQTGDELNLNAWLHRIAANACTDVLRRRRRVRWLPWGALDRDDLAERLDGDPAEALLGAETRHAVQRTLLSQPPYYLFWLQMHPRALRGAPVRMVQAAQDRHRVDSAPRGGPGRRAAARASPGPGPGAAGPG